MSIVLDLLLSIKGTSFFFLNVFNSNNAKLVLLYGLILDFIVVNSLFFFTILLLFLYFILKRVKNYYLKNLVSFILTTFIISLFSRYSLIFLLSQSFFYQIIFIFLNKGHILKW